jgi:hypothetical protein
MKHQARLAQSVERQTLNLVVVGSSPTVGGFPFFWEEFLFFFCFSFFLLLVVVVVVSLLGASWRLHCLLLPHGKSGRSRRIGVLR